MLGTLKGFFGRGLLGFPRLGIISPQTLKRPMIFTAGKHRETLLKIDFGIKNERQNCKISPVCVCVCVWVPVGGKSVNGEMKVRECG
jgi:hypothetical protein